MSEPIVNATCDGSSECEAAVHIHGCFADAGNCDEPGEHENVSVEIPGSPLSRHDLDVIRRELERARLAGFEPQEIVVSARRVREGLRAFGLPVRLNDELHLNQGLLVQPGREPLFFDFEARS